MKAKHDKHVTSIDQIGLQHNNFKCKEQMGKDIYYILKTKSDLNLSKSSIQDFIDD